jgi:hypothetical protein
MTSVATRPGPTRHGDLFYWLGAAGLFLALMSVVYPTLRLPTFETVTVQNPHAWVANVELADPGSSGGGGLGIGTVGPGETISFREVADQGRRWVFHFTYAGVTAELQVDRATLRRNSWTVRVPDAFAAELRAQGVKETPLGAS